MRYFKSRADAGDQLADQLEPKYRFDDCAVVALSDGGVMVGAQIAARLHCVINLLMTEAIKLPREIDTLATIDIYGKVTYNDMYSAGELEALRSEYLNYIEQEKMIKRSEMNKLLGDGGVIDPALLRGRVVIVVSDGLTNGLSMRAAYEFLKPYKIKRLVMVSTFANVAAVDQMHVMADEILCLNVFDEIISVDHYYEDNTMPSHETIIKTISDIILNWK